MIWLYIFAFFLSVILLVMISAGTKRYNNTFYILCAATIVVVDFGYWQRAAAKNLWEALLANRISYLDGTFLTFFMLLALAEFCGIRIPKWLLGVLFSMSSFVLGLVFTGGYQGIYYKEVSMIRLHGISSLEKVYGPAHTFYYILLGIYVLLMTGILLYAVFHKERYSYINILLFFCIVFSCVLVYVVEILADLDITLLPFAYVLMEVFLYLLFRRMNMYDITANAANVRNEKGQYAYIVFNAARKFMGCNEKAEEFFEELGRQKIDYLFPKSETFLYEEFDRWIYDFERGNASSKYIERDGRILYCTLNHFKEGQRGKRHGYLIEVYDDTGRQNHMREIQQMNEKLSRLAEEADKANRAKSEFLASISHELRTPINAVLGLDEMILRETMEPETRIYAENIRTAGDSLLFTVNDLLDISKIEQGKMKIEHLPYSLKDCIMDVLMIILPKAEEKSLSFYIHVEEDVPVNYYGDFMRLKQIFMNLLTNAVKYTERGRIELSVRQEKREGSLSGLLVSVKDTGIGIREEDMDSLFQEFKRFDERKNRDIEGTGLGLSITSNLLALMGSDLKVQSVYGEGSEFSFLLEQECAGDEVMGAFFQKDIVSLQKEAAGRLSMKNEKYHACFTAPDARLLLVDDNKMNLYVLRNLLKTTEIRTDTVMSGAEAIHKIAEQRYDVILMDHLMPEMDGVETLQRMRKEPGNHLEDTAVIMVTANAVSGSEESYLKAGFDDFMVKPVKGELLENMLLKYLPSEKVKRENRKKSGLNEPEEKGRELKRVFGEEIEVREGLAYANGDYKFYTELLKIFAGEYEEKHLELQEALKALETSASYRSFTRLVHDLKGEARGIGAFMLGELFYSLEQAGKQEEKDSILLQMPETIEKYEKVVRLIKKAV